MWLAPFQQYKSGNWDSIKLVILNAPVKLYLVEDFIAESAQRMLDI